MTVGACPSSSGRALTLLTVVGARPQFVKAAVVSRALRSVAGGAAEGAAGDAGGGAAGTGVSALREVLVHTGQHYDANMSQVFFDEMEIPAPDHHLGVGSGSHGVQTAAMLVAIESVIEREKPDWVLVYGDTNSTLAGALAAAKLHVPVAHVEAGLRSFNRRMPEEVNRVLTDHLADVLFCPTPTAVANLAAEGIGDGKGADGGAAAGRPCCPRDVARRREPAVVLTGDVMFDAARFYAERARGRDTLARLGVTAGGFALATIHRAESTGSLPVLEGLLATLDAIGSRHLPVVWPVHPRTRHLLAADSAARARWLETPRPHLRLIEPLGYLDMVVAEQAARLIVTDSGGVQKEAFFHGVPCVTLRTETEWVELVEAGWNRVVGLEPAAALTAVEAVLAADWRQRARPPLYGTGDAGERIVRWFREHGARRSPRD